MRGVDGKTAVVTGGGYGIGRATAERFAAAGANVVVADVDTETGPETVERIAADGGEATFVETDVADEDDVEAMVAAAVDAYGSLDFAHNNAGIGTPVESTAEMTTEEWDRMIDVNLRGVWLCMREELDRMTEGDGGVIVNTSSVAGLLAEPHLAHYAAAKHGVVGLTKTAAVEYADRDVRVNALCPGITDTPLAEGALEALVDTTPMGRAADPAEVGGMAVWLCSDEASFVTGVSLPIDGGALVGRE